MASNMYLFPKDTLNHYCIALIATQYGSVKWSTAARRSLTLVPYRLFIHCIMLPRRSAFTITPCIPNKYTYVHDETSDSRETDIGWLLLKTMGLFEDACVSCWSERVPPRQSDHMVGA